ncbi:MAG: sugar phosphate isomerase/epimerase [Nitrospiraceae bacterium]|nr:sugar phosphate isomerase/epimerase [Nitrospiraceae bacterium]MDA8325563.1 sugar phosphate isomerase/epimerase [Nitrospiraceae bacterium]
MRPHIHVPFGRLEEFAPLLRQHGLDLELYIQAGDMDDLRPDWLRRAMRLLDYGPELSIHAPFMDLCPGAVDEKIRVVTVLRFEKTLEMARRFAAKTVVFHSGYEKWKYAMRVDIWLEKSVLTWMPLIETAGRYDMRIAVENIFEDSPGNLIALFERLGSGRFGLCFDTGHFNLFSKSPLESWLGPLKKYIIELHLHDNDGSHDAHRPIGDGKFPFKKLFDELKGFEDGLVHTIEAHSPGDALESLNRLRDILP